MLKEEEEDDDDDDEEEEEEQEYEEDDFRSFCLPNEERDEMREVIKMSASSKHNCLVRRNNLFHQFWLQ